MLACVCVSCVYLRLQLFAQRVSDCEPWGAKGAGRFQSFIVVVRNIKNQSFILHKFDRTLILIH